MTISEPAVHGLEIANNLLIINWLREIGFVSFFVCSSSPMSFARLPHPEDSACVKCLRGR